jgi:hypothetical protein
MIASTDLETSTYLDPPSRPLGKALAVLDRRSDKRKPRTMRGAGRMSYVLVRPFRSEKFVIQAKLAFPHCVLDVEGRWITRTETTRVETKAL